MAFEILELLSLDIAPIDVHDPRPGQSLERLDTLSLEIVLNGPANGLGSAHTAFHTHQFVDQFLINRYCRTHTYLHRT